MVHREIRTITKTEKSWILYDVGNSAFVLVMVTAIMPIFFKEVAAKGMADVTATAYWGFANAAAALMLAVLSPILGTIADYNGLKMKMFSLFLLLGLVFTGSLLFVGEGMWFLCLSLFVLARMGWAGANLFYDATIVDVVNQHGRSPVTPDHENNVSTSTVNRHGRTSATPDHENDMNVFTVKNDNESQCDRPDLIEQDNLTERDNLKPYGDQIFGQTFQTKKSETSVNPFQDMDRRMDRISSLGYGWGYIGSVIPFLVIIALIMTAGSDDVSGATSTGALPQFQTKVGFAIVLVWWALFSIPMLLNVKQKHAIPPSSTPVADSFRRLYQTFHDIRTSHRQVFIFLLAYFFYIDGVGTIISMAGAYGRDLGFSVPLLIGVILFIQLVAFPFALLYGKLAERYSALFMLKVGIIVYCIITVIAFSLPSIGDPTFKVATFWLIAFLVASSMGGLQALSRSIFASLIPPEKSGEFFGFYNIFGKFAAISGPLLMGGMGALTGDTRWGVLTLLGLFILGWSLLGKVTINNAMHHG